MATVTTLSNPLSSGKHVRHLDNNVFPALIWFDVDLAAAATAKGSALAANDVIEVVRVPAGTLVVGAYIKKVSALTGTVSVLTVDIGAAAGNTYGSGVDLFALGVGDEAGAIGATTIKSSTTAGDTIDVKLASLTGTLTGGVIRVGVIAYDLKTKARGVIAPPKS